MTGRQPLVPASHWHRVMNLSKSTPRDEGVAGARRMPCGYSARLGRSPERPPRRFYPVSRQALYPELNGGASALRGSRSQDRRSRRERPEGERSEASPGRGHRSAPPMKFRSTRDPFSGADARIISRIGRGGISPHAIPGRPQGAPSLRRSFAALSRGEALPSRGGASPPCRGDGVYALRAHSGSHSPWAAMRSSVRFQIWSRSSSAAVCGSIIAA